MIYREIKNAIKSLETAINQAENTDNKYATSGRMQKNNQRLADLEGQLDKSIINLDRVNTDEVMKHIKTIAETATSADDFDDHGIFFDPDNRKSLLWWLAELLPLPKGWVICKTMDDLQRVRVLTEQTVGTWTCGSMDGCYDDFHATLDYCECTAKSPSIAMSVALADFIIQSGDHNHSAAPTPPMKAPGL